jgi:mannose-1-phosphate guanylyltransferase
MHQARPGQELRPTWSLVLAGGEGSRLHSRTRREDGVAVPKQFFPLMEDGSTPLDDTLARMAPIVPDHKTMVVLAEHHRPFWTPLVEAGTARHWLVQPESRGTGLATLLGLLRIERQAPDAIVIMTPADHGIRHVESWRQSLRRAVSWADAGGVTLVGVPGEGLDDGYGWIVPTEPIGTDVARVGTFVEKPDPRTAKALREAGALISTFVVVGRVVDLIGLFEVAVPGLVAMTQRHVSSPLAWLPRQIKEFFGAIPTIDFSADVLALVPQRLLVMRAADCGWSDLGTPERLDGHMQVRPKSHASPLTLNLAMSHAA